MKLSLTQAQMLRRWRRKACLEALPSTVSIDRVDGIDADALIIDRMRLWYLGLLDNAPLAMLAPEEYASSLNLVAGTGFATVKIPSQCRRILSARLSSWKVPASVVDHDSAAETIRRQRNPFASATNLSPLAVMEHGQITLVPFSPGDSLASVVAVVDPGDEMYVFDETALDLIPDFVTPQTKPIEL